MKVILTPYTPAWQNIYELYKQKWLEIFESTHIIVDIQHIGSTSVPNLLAKNIIDILVGVSDYEPQKEVLVQTVAQHLPAFNYLAKWNEEMPYRRFFSVPMGEGIEGVGVNVHCVQHGAEFWERHILFRNYLLQNPNKALEYEQVKQELCSQEWQSIADYAGAKTAFIRKAESEAVAFFKNKK